MTKAHTYAIHLSGIVEGVGMRPFIYKLAQELGVSGWVNNASDGVHIRLRCTLELAESFIAQAKSKAPLQSRIDGVECEKIADEPALEGKFEILKSAHRRGDLTLVSPDIATCPDCLHELFDPADRRYHYPFINCTQCGPRFTIIEELPYDRPFTSMSRFKMCEACANEYADPTDRRFHAQPDACFACGPQLFWLEGHDEKGGAERACDLQSSDALIDRAADALREGKILAVKGLGGYHLACDAANSETVSRLRERKHRPDKPFACMFPNMESIRRVCHVGKLEEELLCGSVRPIVLLRMRGDALAGPIAPEIAKGLRELGVMLPHTPLQHLLLSKAGRPLVMTSGNISDEPIIADDSEACGSLGKIADCILGNNRPILSRYDDSVTRWAEGAVQIVRRARGYAPDPVRLPGSLQRKSVLGCGAEQKNAFCLTRDGLAFVSQHMGDLHNTGSWDNWLDSKSAYEKLFSVTPWALACDKHPAYTASNWAREEAGCQDIPLMEVQHHHAHIAAVTGEHGVSHQVLGIALDGTGYGDDGTIWGGELLVCDWRESRRVASLEPLALPGGEAAVREPWRIAYAALERLGLTGHPGAGGFLSEVEKAVPQDKRSFVVRMAESGLNSPSCSSAGRLFDCVSALCGCVLKASYDGQAAMELEALADAASKAETARHVGKEQSLSTTSGSGGLERIDSASLIEEVLELLASGEDRARIASRFHESLCERFADAAARHAKAEGLGKVALSGGVFMNRVVLHEMRLRLESAGLEVLTHKALPPNDACISYGQAVVALASLEA